MHATTATCLLGGSGSGPLKVLAYASLFFRYSSVTDMGTSSMVVATITTQRPHATGENHREQMATAALSGGTGRPSDRGPSGRSGLAEVVDGRAADVDRGEVLLHPRGDLFPRSRPAVPEPAAVACNEVAHSVIGDVGLELRPCRRVVRTGESTDRHERS